MDYWFDSSGWFDWYVLVWMAVPHNGVLCDFGGMVDWLGHSSTFICLLSVRLWIYRGSLVIEIPRYRSNSSIWSFHSCTSFSHSFTPHMLHHPPTPSSLHPQPQPKKNQPRKRRRRRYQPPLAKRNPLPPPRRRRRRRLSNRQSRQKLRLVLPRPRKIFRKLFWVLRGLRIRWRCVVLYDFIVMAYGTNM